MNRAPLIGLDFDNTLISYDQLFFACALECGLIPESLSADKIAVRDHLRESGREDMWTRLQVGTRPCRHCNGTALPCVS